MPQSHDLSNATWRKSSRSGGAGECVELARLGGVAVRDSKNPTGTVLGFSREEWRIFTGRLKADKHDL